MWLNWTIYSSLCRALQELLVLLMTCAFTSHMPSPLYSTIISQVKLLQTTLQLGLWAGFDDVEHRLWSVTWTLVSRCIGPTFFTAGCAVTLLISRLFINDQSCRGQSYPGCWIARLSIMEEFTIKAMKRDVKLQLTIKASFQSSMWTFWTYAAEFLRGRRPTNSIKTLMAIWSQKRHCLQICH